MIYGENRPYNICMIVPDFLVLDKYAQEHNLPTDHEELTQNKEIQDLIINEVLSSLKGKYGGYEIPKKFVFISEDFTVENGTLTQTLKLKRRVVLKKYKDLIDAQYQR